MREMSVAEQRYQAVLAVIKDGRTVSEVASQWSVSRQTLHAWLAKYEAGGLEGLGDRSRRPVSCPHQMPAQVEALVLELRRVHPYWGAQRIALQLARKNVTPAPSESAVYRCLVRAGVIDPRRRRRRRENWKRWERGRPMELWQIGCGRRLPACGRHLGEGIDRSGRSFPVLRFGAADASRTHPAGV